MKKTPLGQQQLEVLQYVSDHAPITVAQVAAHFGATQGLARTTILSVMERLREKGYLTRTRQQGAFAYSPRESKAQLLRSLIDNFVEQSLGGSSLPLVAYLSEKSDLSQEEAEQLRQLARELEHKRRAGSKEGGKS